MSAVSSKWLLDASTFIHACIARQLRVLITLRSQLIVPLYVYQYEIAGPKAHEQTRTEASRCLDRGEIQTATLSLPDLQRLEALRTSRKRVGFGEAACAVIAERLAGGVLCDDHKAVVLLRGTVAVSLWECIEDVLVAAAHDLHLSEYDLAECERSLAAANYTCRFSLRDTYLMQHYAKHSRTPTPRDGDAGESTENDPG